MNARLERLTKRPVRIHVLGGLLTVTTIAALVGGSLLLWDPSGGVLGFTVADLGTAPFADYRIPGALLLGFFGVLPLPILVGLWRESPAACELAGMVGAGLAIWVTAQIIWFGELTPIQPVVWTEGMILLGLGGAPMWRLRG